MHGACASAVIRGDTPQRLELPEQECVGLCSLPGSRQRSGGVIENAVTKIDHCAVCRSILRLSSHSPARSTQKSSSAYFT